jgi:hypothetical protein
MGLSRRFSVVAIDQPGKNFAETSANGVPAGSVTVSLTVLAVSDSVGTRKTSFPKPPGEPSGDDTLTCAETAGAIAIVAATAMNRTVAYRVRRRSLVMIEGCLSRDRVRAAGC